MTRTITNWKVTIVIALKLAKLLRAQHDITRSIYMPFIKGSTQHASAQPFEDKACRKAALLGFWQHLDLLC